VGDGGEGLLPSEESRRPFVNVIDSQNVPKARVERYIESTALASLSATCELCASRNWEAEGAGAVQGLDTCYIRTQRGVRVSTLSGGGEERGGAEQQTIAAHWEFVSCSLPVLLLLQSRSLDLKNCVKSCGD
jgi:hypothetical protein